MDELYLALLLQVQANILQEEVLQNILKIRRLIRKRRRRRPQVWIRSWLTEQQRLDHSQYYRLVQKLRTEDPNYFKSYMRMPLELFDEILERVRPAISGPGYRVATHSLVWHSQVNMRLRSDRSDRLATV